MVSAITCLVNGVTVSMVLGDKILMALKMTSPHFVGDWPSHHTRLDKCVCFQEFVHPLSQLVDGMQVGSRGGLVYMTSAYT